MNYMLMIYRDEAADPTPGSPEFGQMMAGYQSLTEELRENGKMVAGDPLESIATATTVRVREGNTVTTDGPFAETKEQLGGYYIVDCADLDEAISYAAKIPTAGHGSIEVRPIMVFD